MSRNGTSKAWWIQELMRKRDSYTRFNEKKTGKTAENHLSTYITAQRSLKPSTTAALINQGWKPERYHQVQTAL
ncbi:MAG: hypothetical protein M1812_007504 [Candelaria pacifica]|nr:MAG: hypothetical protein M1812_007504 [Candelaria pacifica]